MAKTLLAFLALLTIQYAFAASISFKWCALPKEMAKCAEFINYVKIIAQNQSLEVAVECVNTSTHKECIAKIKSSKADLVTLDGGDVYTAGMDHNLVPIVSEQYGEYGVKYYGVAVVRKNNTGFNLKTLKGRTSCHTRFGRTAGWIVPVGYLLREGIMKKALCNGGNYSLKAASKFFNESCVPGLSGEEATKYKNLCKICADKGKCSTDDKYADYKGAFMCMGDKAGDVAFVKHTTTQEVVATGKYGVEGDYEYLCKDGSRKSVAGNNHETCNLGNNPGHAVVTRKDNSDIVKIINILTTMSDKYGSSQTNWTQFQLFNSTGYGGADLLFKDSATELKEIPSDKRTYDGYLGEDYVKDKKAMDSCDKVDKPATDATPTSTSSTVSPIIELVLLIALLGAAHRFL